MFYKKIAEKIFTIGLIAFSSLIGIRLVNEYLKYDDRPKGIFSSSSRVLSDGSKLYVAHPQNYNISTSGKDTVVFVSDSFGQGIKYTFNWYYENKKYFKSLSKKDIIKRLGQS